MSNHQEKTAFAQRLNEALNQGQHPISPTYLANEFNHRYTGQAISIQSANNWLLGISHIRWLIQASWIRFGISHIRWLIQASWIR